MSRLARLTYIQRNQRKVQGDTKKIIINIDNILQFEQLEDQEDGANYLVKYDTHGLTRDNKTEIFRCTDISDNFFTEVPTCSLMLFVVMKEDIRRMNKVLHLPTSYFIYAEPLVDYNYLSMTKIFCDGSNNTGDNDFKEYLVTAGMNDIEQSCGFGITQNNDSTQNRVYDIQGLSEIIIPRADIVPFGDEGVFQVFMNESNQIVLTACQVELLDSADYKISWGYPALGKSFLVLT